MSTSFHFYGVVCPIVLWRPRDILSEYFLVSTGQAGHLVPRRPSSCTELSSVGSPCTKLKRVPLEHPLVKQGGDFGHPQGEATRMQHAGDTAINCKGQILLSHLWPAHSYRNLFVRLFFLFSTTPGILVSLQGHGFFGALKEKP